MTYKTLQYSLKVWLSSAALAPFIFLIVLTARDGFRLENLWDFINTGLCIYFILVLLELLFSFFTWIAFTLAAALMVKFMNEGVRRTGLICVSGIVLTVATFAGVFDLFNLFDDKPTCIALITCNCICTGAFSLIYKIKPIAPEIAL